MWGTPATQMNQGYGAPMPWMNYGHNRSPYPWQWNPTQFGGQQYGWNAMYGQQYGNPWYMGMPQWWQQGRPVPACDYSVAA